MKARTVQSYRLESQQWFKDLEDLADRRHGGKDLSERIHAEILVKGQEFTEDKLEAFKDGVELFGKLVLIHQSYVETPNNFGGGQWGDMFGEWLTATQQLDSRHGQFLTPQHISQFMTQMALGSKEDLEGEPKIISDPTAGTGRFMLDTAKYYAETLGQLNFIFVNIDIEFRVYVYCAMNAILHAIPTVTIWGNSLGLPKDYNEALVTIPIGRVAMWKFTKPRNPA
jgi:type I restriction-modification system DNA methylase subunit